MKIVSGNIKICYDEDKLVIRIMMRTKKKKKEEEV